MKHYVEERLEIGPDFLEHQPINLVRRENGKSTVDIRCPYCSHLARDVRLWSLSGSGKRCPGCGALHVSGGRTKAPPEKKHRKGRKRTRV